MEDSKQLLSVIEKALDPERFFEALSEDADGRAFLAGTRDTVTLTRRFPAAEAAIAQKGIEALNEIRGHLGRVTGA